MSRSDADIAKNILWSGAILLVLILPSMWAYPSYNVWSQGKAGEARLREAESSRKIAVEEAQAELDAMKLKSQSEIEQARGVAEANKIIGDSLQGNEDYLRYLWIKGLHDGSSEVIYIPTEAGLPILEAGRFQRNEAKVEEVPVQ